MQAQEPTHKPPAATRRDWPASALGGAVARKTATHAETLLVQSWVNSQGSTSSELADTLQAPRSKVCEWLAQYDAHGVEGLQCGNLSGLSEELDPLRGPNRTEAGNPAKVAEELQFCEAALPISHLSCGLGA